MENWIVFGNFCLGLGVQHVFGLEKRLSFVRYLFYTVKLMKDKNIFDSFDCNDIYFAFNNTTTMVCIFYGTHKTYTYEVTYKTYDTNRISFVYILSAVYRAARNENFCYDFDICIFIRVGKNMNFGFELKNVRSIRVSKNINCVFRFSKFLSLLMKKHLPRGELIYVMVVYLVSGKESQIVSQLVVLFLVSILLLVRFKDDG